MALNDNFILKSGKYAGKSIALIKKIDYQYIAWCEINCPNILKEKKSEPKEKKVYQPKTEMPKARKEVPEESETPASSLQPNLDFLKQTGDYQFYKKEEDNDNTSKSNI